MDARGISKGLAYLKPIGVIAGTVIVTCAAVFAFTVSTFATISYVDSKVGAQEKRTEVVETTVFWMADKIWELKGRPVDDLPPSKDPRKRAGKDER